MKKIIQIILFCCLVIKTEAQVWRQLPGGSLNGDVYAITSFGGFLWVSGTFSQAGPVSCQFIIRHDGTQWISTPTPNGVARNFCVYNNELYAFGGFNLGPNHYGIMKWNGFGWTPMAQLLPSDYIETGTSYNGDLVVGGRFTIVDGIPCDYIAKWNGTSWSSLCAGLMENNSAVPEVKVLYTAKGCIYAGGAFSKICGVNTANAAKWNGSFWIALPVIGGITSYISRGSDVIVAGSFPVAGPAISQSIAKEDTVSVGDWLKLSPADIGVKINAITLAIWNSKLYIAGSHTTGSGYDVWNCGYWDGINWTPDHQGLNSNSLILALYNNPITNVLYAGGTFNTQIGDTADYIAYKSLSPLPIELASLDASCDVDEHCVQLKWKTFSEHDNVGFWVERSYDGREFSKLTFVSGEGTTNEIHAYEFCDYDFSSPISYYRLSQIDYSGECNYSKMIVAHCLPHKESSTSVVHDFLELHSSCAYEIWNMLGQQIRKGIASQVSFRGCAPGIYILKTLQGNKLVSRKILKY